MSSSCPIIGSMTLSSAFLAMETHFSSLNGQEDLRSQRPKGRHVQPVGCVLLLEGTRWRGRLGKRGRPGQESDPPERGTRTEGGWVGIQMLLLPQLQESETCASRKGRCGRGRGLFPGM